MKTSLKKLVRAAAFVGIAAFVGVTLSHAGPLNPPGPPAPTGYTLSDVYGKLTTGTDATEAAHSLSPPASPASTMYTLTEVYAAADTLWEKARVGLPATGLTVCYDGTTANTIPCANTGQDGEHQAGRPFRSFIDHGNGTVTATSTGLMWQRCSRGQNNDSTCTGTATTANWPTAVSYCNDLSLATHTDWRLPNIYELFSLTDQGKTSAPYIDTDFFPATLSDFYWSSTSLPPPNATLAHVVGFNAGNAGFSNKTFTFYVRCVRG